MNIVQHPGRTISTKKLALALCSFKDSICRQPGLQIVCSGGDFWQLEKGISTTKGRWRWGTVRQYAAMCMLCVHYKVSMGPNTIVYALQHGVYIDKKEDLPIAYLLNPTTNQIYPTSSCGVWVCARILSFFVNIWVCYSTVYHLEDHRFRSI